jgi:hypothetical protein
MSVYVRAGARVLSMWGLTGQQPDRPPVGEERHRAKKRLAGQDAFGNAHRLSVSNDSSEWDRWKGQQNKDPIDLPAIRP